MGKMQREKGKRGERAVAQILTSLTGRDVRRRVRQHDGDSDLVGFEPWCIEVKFTSTLLPDQWWKQAVAQTDGDSYPVLIYKLTGARTWKARCRLVDLFEANDTQPPPLGWSRELHVEMPLDQWVQAIGEYNPR
jgi:hypothetical protein